MVVSKHNHGRIALAYIPYKWERNLSMLGRKALQHLDKVPNNIIMIKTRVI